MNHDPYTVELITPKQVIVNKPTHLWDITYDNYTAITKNPVNDIEPRNPPEPFTVTAIYHHSIGYDYYLPESNILNGYNVVDCDDYPAPVAEPIPARVFPAGALTADSPAYNPIIKDIPSYMSPLDASKHHNSVGTITAGVHYFLFRTLLGMDNVTLVSGSPGMWINPRDNLEDPPELPPPVLVSPKSTNWTDPRSAPVETTLATPDPIYDGDLVPNNVWKSTNKLLYADERPELYISQNRETIYVYDLDSGDKEKHAIKLKPNTELHIVSFFEKDGVEYGRAKRVAEQNRWYGIPMTILKSYDEIYRYSTTLAERAATKNIKLSDYPALWFANVRKMFGVK